MQDRMKKTFVIVYLFLLLGGVSCTSKVSSQCELKEIKTLFTTEGVYDGKIIGYAHYILIKNFSKDCIDSATMVDIALKYADTIKIGRPANVLKFFSTDKDFIPNETSQDMQLINKSCLVDISIDTVLKKPKSFIFYKDNGEINYWGERWKPTGK